MYMYYIIKKCLNDIGSVVCDTIYTIYLSLCTQTADPILPEPFSRDTLYVYPKERTCINTIRFTHTSLQVGQLIIYYTPKKVLLFAFFFLTYKAFKSREGIFSQTSLAEWFKIGHLWKQTRIWMIF